MKEKLFKAEQVIGMEESVLSVVNSKEKKALIIQLVVCVLLAFCIVSVYCFLIGASAIMYYLKQNSKPLPNFLDTFVLIFAVIVEIVPFLFWAVNVIAKIKRSKTTKYIFAESRILIAYKDDFLNVKTIYYVDITNYKVYKNKVRLFFNEVKFDIIPQDNLSKIVKIIEDKTSEN